MFRLILHSILVTLAEASANHDSAKCEQGMLESCRADLPKPCDSWHLVWHTFQMMEQDYVENQLLQNVNIRNVTNLYLFKGQLPGRAKKNDPRRFLENKSPEDCSFLVLRGRQGNAKVNSRILQQYIDRKLRFAIYIAGEEDWGCKKTKSLIEKSPVVFRNYWHRDCEAYQNVKIVPLGIVKGELPSEEIRDRKLSERKYVWSFASRHRLPKREKITSLFSQSGLNPGFLAYPGRDPNYVDTLCETQFALCPDGNVPDTWRIMEALHCGAIPVVMEGGKYFREWMPEVAQYFVEIDAEMTQASMQKAIRNIENLLHSKDKLNAHGDALHSAFAKYNKEWRQNVSKILQDII